MNIGKGTQEEESNALSF